MKIQKEGGRVLNLPDRLASRLIAKGRFVSAEESEEELQARLEAEKAEAEKKAKEAEEKRIAKEKKAAEKKAKKEAEKNKKAK